MNLLDRVVEHYLDESNEFEGLPVADKADREDAARLVRERKVVVLFEGVDPSVRRFDETPMLEKQLRALQEANNCYLFPMPKVLAPHLSGVRAPYVLRLAMGLPQCELAFFDLNVLARYREDPSYWVEVFDYEIVIEERESARDPRALSAEGGGSMIRAGYGFAFSGPNGAMAEFPRLLCATLRDLAQLPDQHQEHFALYEAPLGNPAPHPMWAQRNLMGRPNALLGPFDKVVGELSIINQMWETIWGLALFQTVTRPDHWGWLIRPASHEWDRFISATDKMLSQNLSSRGLDATGVASRNEGGQSIGTLVRLEGALMHKMNVPESKVKEMMKPWREIRTSRNHGSGHGTRSNQVDRSAERRQVALMKELATGLTELRRFLGGYCEVHRSVVIDIPPQLEGKWVQW